MKLKAWISALFACLLLCGCETAEAPDIPPAAEKPLEYSTEAPLMCDAQTQEEAQAIAEQYGIELVGYSYGIATYYTGEDPSAVIQRGKDNGWPELSLNKLTQLD